MDLAAFFLHEEAGKKFLDNVGPGGDGPETAGLSEGSGQGAVLVLHVAHRIFHGCDQGAFGKISGRSGLSLRGPDGVYHKVRPFFKWDGCFPGERAVCRIIFKALFIIRLRILPAGAIDLPPSGLQDHISLCAERFTSNRPGQGCLLVFACRGEDGKEPADDQIIDPSLFV